MITLAQATSNTGWVVGYAIGIAVVLVVVALVVPILMLARRIGQEAGLINDHLVQSVENTAALENLETTNQMAINVIEGLKRGRERLGG